MDAAAEDLPRHEPAVCTGLFYGGKIILRKAEPGKPETYESAIDIRAEPKWSLRTGVCPENYAVLSVIPALGRPTNLDPDMNAAQCCKLPAGDILLDEHQLVDEMCPEDFIATGGTMLDNCENCVRKLHCTRINTARYKLSIPRSGVFWGLRAHYWVNPERIFWSEIPAGMRYGAGRWGLSYWSEHGCVGFPFGSLLTKRASKRCGNLEFKQLQYRGIGGDPVHGTPVQIFPDCRDIDDEFSANPACVRQRP